jgi:hypothetical protein
MNWETTEEMKNEIEQTWTEVEMTEQIKLRDWGEERLREWDEVKWDLPNMFSCLWGPEN